MSGRFRGRSIFCPDKGDITKYALSDGGTSRRSREPPAADLQSWLHFEAAPLQAVGDGSACRRSREPLAATPQSWLHGKEASPPGGGPRQRVQTFPGAACCHATELTTWQSGSPPDR
jgi:hypothetical protein